MFRLTSIIFSMLAVIVLTGCGKDEGGTGKSRTDLLCQAAWKFNAAFSGSTDVSADLASCEKDNIIKFNAVGNGTADEGLTKCNAADPQTPPFTWTFQAGETEISTNRILYSGGVNIFRITTLNESQLIVSQTMVIAGAPKTITLTFVH